MIYWSHGKPWLSVCLGGIFLIAVIHLLTISIGLLVILNSIPPYVPYLDIIKPTSVQPLTATVTEALVLAFHCGSAPWTLWKLSTPLIGVHLFDSPRPPVSRGEQKFIQYPCGMYNPHGYCMNFCSYSTRVGCTSQFQLSSNQSNLFFM